MIAGGGVAGLEGALALSRHAPGLVDVEIIAPSPEFVYRPLQVAEPFGVEAPIRFDLERLASLAGARLRLDALREVRPTEGTIGLSSGAEIRYDALLVALGAQPRDSVPGAINFGTDAGGAGFADLLERIGRPGWRSVAFIVPPAATWTIAAYELAMLTAAEVRPRGLIGVEISVVSHEPRPLEAFGGDVPELVVSRLEEAGIRLHAGVRVTAYRDGALEVEAGDEIPCERAVSLPDLRVAPIEGLPSGAGGFLPTDVHMHVAGLDGIWAAGDATAFPVKQGGLAAQQADVAARTIAVRAGARVPARPFRPVLRAVLITGRAPDFLRSHRGDDDDASHSREPLWWPPEKLAGRYLGPLLAAESAGIEFGELIDLDPPDDRVWADSQSEAAVALLLSSADADARRGKFEEALASLTLVERLDLVLPPEYTARRERWRRALDVDGETSSAAARVDPGLRSAAAAISDLERRIGRLRQIEAETGGRMKRDLTHLDEGLEQLRKLSRETGVLDEGETAHEEGRRAP